MGCRCTADDDDPELELVDCCGATAGRELGRVELACRPEPEESAEGRVLTTRAFSSSVAQPMLAKSNHPRVSPRPLRNNRRCRNPVLLIMVGLLSLPGPPRPTGLSDLSTAELRVRNRVATLSDCKLQASQYRQSPFA